MSPAQKRALEILAMGPMDAACLTINRVQQRLMRALTDKGLAKFCYSTKPQRWRITKAGRGALQAH